jgi:dihydrofolate reductase
MGMLIVSAQMTIDGVIDHSEEWFNGQGTHEDAGFDELRSAGTLLLGRKTYEGLAEVWPKESGALADHVNAISKHVASTTLSGDLSWNAELIRGDVLEAVPELKRAHEANVLMYGCGPLALHLARHGLVDEIRLWVHPVVWGATAATRVFDSDETVRLDAAGTTPFSSGVTLLTYRPTAVELG